MSKRFYMAAAIAGFVAAVLVTQFLALEEKRTINREEGKLATVARVIDGDTIDLTNGQRVRYVGIDTPEKGQCYADEATARNRALVEGKEVWLVSDESDMDIYGRLLRYVFVGDELVNESLLQTGHARAIAIEPDTLLYRSFRDTQDDARAAGLGVWSCQSGERPNVPDGESEYCTADALQCPDGSYVGREAPDCNFAACPSQ